MRVWVNTLDGWIQHGDVRSSDARAAAVAKLLADRLGWEAAAGVTAPPPHPAAAGAPDAAVAARSPAPLNEGLARIPRPSAIGVTEPTSGLDAGSEPYLDELVAFALEAQLRDFLVAN